MSSRDVTAYLHRDYDGEDFAWWRTVAHERNAASKPFESIPMETGERIHRYLLSDGYAQTLSLNGEQQCCLNVTSSVAHVLGACRVQTKISCPLLGVYEGFVWTLIHT